MKIILNQDVHNLGEEGDVVEVKNGYARNFLLPKKMAVLFNKANQALFTTRAAAIERRKEEKRIAAQSLKEKLDSTTLTLVVSAGESGKLFGSVTNAMVQEALAKLDIEIDRKRIEVASHAIKMVGTYSVKIRLYENESATIKVEVINEAEVKKASAEKAAAEKAAAKEAAKHSATLPVSEPEVIEPEYGAEGEEDYDEDEDDDQEEA